MEGNCSLLCHCCPTHVLQTWFCNQANSLSDKVMGTASGKMPTVQTALLQSELGWESHTQCFSWRARLTPTCRAVEFMQHSLSHKPASSPCAQRKKQRSVLILKHNQAKRTLETTIQSSLLLPREFLRIDLARCSLLVSFRTYFTHETYTCGCNFIKIKQEWCHPDTSRLTIPTWSVLLLLLRQHMDIIILGPN